MRGTIDFLDNLEIIYGDNTNYTEPEILKIDDKSYVFDKEIEWLIKDEYGLSNRLSKNIYNLDSDIWNKLIDSIVNESNVSLKDYVFIKHIPSNYIISCIKDDKDPELFKSKIVELASKFDSSWDFESRNGYDIITDVFWKKDNPETFLMIDIDFHSGRYELFYGKNINNKYIVCGSSFSAYNLYDFITGLDIDREYDIASQLVSPAIVDKKLSCRELYDYIKWIKCDVDVDEDNGMAVDITGFSSENSQKIIKSINLFGLPFKSFKKLRFLRKCLKISNISVEDLLGIFTNEFHETNVSITGQVLKELSSNLFNDNVDCNDLKSEGLCE